LCKLLNFIGEILNIKIPYCTDCPDCGSNDVVPWGTGCQCRDCGHEWNGK